MHRYIFLLLLLLLQIPALTMGCDKKTAQAKQNDDIWISFWNEDSTLVGYKDKNGVVKIEPKFSSYTPSDYFDNIIVVYDDEIKNFYHLAKSGKVFGIDSVYIFENSPTFECGGFITFRDRKTELVGLFDRNGNVVIPAEYNFLEEVRNGMLTAMKGAWKEPHEHNGDCDHRGFVGGKILLIDTLNNVLIEDFLNDTKDIYPFNLNFFSAEKSKDPHPDTTRISLKAKDGSYYSFVVYEKEFKQWLFGELLANLTPEKLMDAMQNTITSQSANYLEKENDGRQFAKDNFELLKNELSKMLNPNNKYYIHGNLDGDCRAHPTIDVRIPVPNSYDNSFDFSRTENGYKLNYVSIRNVKSFR